MVAGMMPGAKFNFVLFMGKKAFAKLSLSV
jgi:hypothetical protein